MPKKQKNVQKFTKHILLLYLKFENVVIDIGNPK